LSKSDDVHQAHMHAQLVGLAGAACLDQPVSNARKSDNASHVEQAHCMYLIFFLFFFLVYSSNVIYEPVPFLALPTAALLLCQAGGW